MNKSTKIHIFLCCILFVISVMALYFRWSGMVSGTVIILINVYLAAMLYEAIHRSEEKRTIVNGVLSEKPPYLFPFPSKAWAGLLILLIVCASIAGFANLYIASEEIVYVGPDPSTLSAESEISFAASPSIMKNRTEALYFSLVTMITLGYGDFIPVSTAARLLVMWQLTTAGLLVIGVFPLFIARAADF